MRFPGMRCADADMVAHSEHVSEYYQWFLDVEIMVFLGFGCLMTFLRRYSYSAIAFNFFISCFVMLYSILILGVFSQVRRASWSDVLYPVSIHKGMCL